MSKAKKSGGSVTTKATAKKKGKKAAEAKAVVAVAEVPATAVVEAEPVPEAVAEPAKVPKADKPLSCLDAAAKVLADKGEPMRVKEIIDAVFQQKLWHSDAPTPAATLVSAILREMKKGEASRFTKAGRGLFGLNARGN